MFMDIVKEYSMRKDKVNFYINYGIAPVFRDEMLLACVKWTLHYVLFDWSFCHIFRDNQLDLYYNLGLRKTSTKYSLSRIKILEESSCRELLNVLFELFLAWIEGEWLCSLRIEKKNRRLRTKKIESIIAKIHDIIWEIQEVY